MSLALKTGSVMCTHVHTHESSDETSSAYDHVNEIRDANLGCYCATKAFRNVFIESKENPVII